jgi:hypothetical protein
VPGIVGWLKPDGGRGAFSGMTFGLATQLRISVRAPVAELSWLDGGARSSNEQVKKNR